MSRPQKNQFQQVNQQRQQERCSDNQPRKTTASLKWTQKRQRRNQGFNQRHTVLRYDRHQRSRMLACKVRFRMLSYLRDPENDSRIEITFRVDSGVDCHFLDNACIPGIEDMIRDFNVPKPIMHTKSGQEFFKSTQVAWKENGCP